MNKFFLLFAISTILNACSQQRKADGGVTSNSSFKADTIQQDTLPFRTSINIDTISGKEFVENDTSLSSERPAITPLPFGSLKESSIYSELIGNNVIGDHPTFTPTYRLPPVKRVTYIVVDSSRERSICNENIPFDSLFRINKYKYRLPDISKYEVYYMCNDATKFNDFTKAFDRYCDFNYNFYGHLIFYDKKSKEAKVLLIYYTYYVDAYVERVFYISKDYKINLTERMVSEGENGADPPVIVGKYEIRLKASGEINIFSSRI